VRETDVMEHVRSEGGLLPSDLLERVRAMDRDLPGMTADAYGLASDRRLKEVLSEEVAVAWTTAKEHWNRFSRELAQLDEAARGTSLTRERWLLPLLGLLGFEGVEARTADERAGATYPISHGWQDVPIHLLSVRVELDRRTAGVAGAARQSPYGMVQDYLNRTPDSLWALVSNGRRLRILRDNASMTRQAFVEFDLEGIFEGEGYHSFALLWLVCHRTRFDAERPELSFLERWVETAQREGARALDQLRAGVEKALETLGTGLLSHPANAALLESLQRGDLAPQDLYRELLRVIYRLLFLFVAEDRDLLLLPAGQTKPEARQRYERFYSTTRLRSLARRRAGTGHDDLWRQVQIVMWGLGTDEGLPTLALPALGGLLWQQSGTRHAVGEPEAPTRLRNGDLLEVIRHLAFMRQGRTVRRVDYRNLGPEELGSVYESLLELHPQVSVGDRSFRLSAGAGNERKTTGSYYTPVSLINQLLDTALDPVLDRAEAEPEPIEGLLSVTVCDPACGSGHFLVAAAHRIANRLARHYEASDDEGKRAQPFAEAMRDVVSRCIYGVDINAMATELAKVNLWLEAHVPGKPLTFLDHHLKTGNSLLGTTPALISRGIPDAAFKELRGDDRKTCSGLRKGNTRLRDHGFLTTAAERHADYDALAHQADVVGSMSDDDPTELHRKEEAYRGLDSSDQVNQARLVADSWCAAFTSQKTPSGPWQHPFELFYQVSQGNPPAISPAYEVVDRERLEYGFFHWHVEFPHLFTPKEKIADDDPTGWTGGFSVMLGNPPWERIKIQEKEWFASRDPDIATARNKSDRDKLIKALYTAPEDSPERRLAEDWEEALREAEVVSHVLRTGGRYPLGGVGDVNTYAVFADLFQSSIDGRGRMGLVCPTGLATGATYSDFFGYLVTSRRLHSFFTFENEERLFPDVHNQFKYGLMTVAGADDPATAMVFTGYVRQAKDLTDPERRYVLTPDDVAAMNPNTLTAPIFRRARDAEVTAQIHRSVPVLVRDEGEGGNPWGISFLSMLHMANDSHLFVRKEQAETRGGTLVGTIFEMPDGERLLPLYEGKMVWHYDHRYGTYKGQTQKQANKGVLPHVADEQHADPDFAPLFRYWVPEKLVEDNLEGRWDREWMIGFRDVGPSERTLVTAVVPTAAAGHKFPIILPGVSSPDSVVLYAMLTSLVCDYAIRQKTSSQMSYFYLKQAPVLPPSVGDQKLLPGVLVRDFVLPRVVELCVTDWQLTPLAEDVLGWSKPLRWDPQRRPVLQAELDALFFHLYGLERDDVAWVLDSFTVLEKYERRDHGEFRTKRLVLEVFDDMADAIRGGTAYVSRLDPPPGDPALPVDAR
jgi:hypothetical protein